MTKTYPTNKKIHFIELGNSFVIEKVFNSNGSENLIGDIVFSKSDDSNILSYKLYENKEYSFNLQDMKKNRFIDFNPDFIEIKTNNDLSTIKVNVLENI